jgi:hypothetical protein
MRADTPLLRDNGFTRDDSTPTWTPPPTQTHPQRRFMAVNSSGGRLGIEWTKRGRDDDKEESVNVKRERLGPFRLD